MKIVNRCSNMEFLMSNIQGGEEGGIGGGVRGDGVGRGGGGGGGWGPVVATVALLHTA